MKRKTVGIIGIGRFGYSVCQELVKLGADVVAIDKSEDSIRLVQEIVNNAVICDSTKAKNLKNVGVQNLDEVIVGIGQDIESSIMTTLILKDLGVKYIAVKVENEYHAKICERLGANEIIKPEETIGRRTARKLMFTKISDYIDLSDGFGMVEMEVTDKIIDIPLMKLDVRNKYFINISAIRRGSKVFIPKADDRLIKGDILVIIGEDKFVNLFSKYLNK